MLAYYQERYDVNDPRNEKEKHYEVCPECDGAGILYFGDYEERISKEEWEMRDEKERDSYSCDCYEGRVECEECEHN